MRNRDATDRLDALDGLRGLAAIAVVVSHSANAKFIPGIFGGGFGQIGVTLFYALSGFLMASLYLSLSFDEQAAKRYTINRLARVLPLYYAVVLASAVLMVLGIRVLDFDTISELIRSAVLIQGQSVL